MSNHMFSSHDGWKNNAAELREEQTEDPIKDGNKSLQFLPLFVPVGFQNVFIRQFLKIKCWLSQQPLFYGSVFINLSITSWKIDFLLN